VLHLSSLENFAEATSEKGFRVVRGRLGFLGVSWPHLLYMRTCRPSISCTRIGRPSALLRASAIARAVDVLMR